MVSTFSAGEKIVVARLGSSQAAQAPVQIRQPQLVASTASVTRGDCVVFTLENPPFAATLDWSYAPNGFSIVNRGQNFDGNASCQGGNGTTTWAGPIVVSGSTDVTVTLNGNDVPVTPVAVAVNPRSWVLSVPNSSVEIPNTMPYITEINCYGIIRSVSSPPRSADHVWGQSCQQGLPQYLSTPLAGYRPNHGFKYVLGLEDTVNIQWKFLISPDLWDTNSPFFICQNGNSQDPSRVLWKLKMA
jgi:hypothetical protein